MGGNWGPAAAAWGMDGNGMGQWNGCGGCGGGWGGPQAGGLQPAAAKRQAPNFAADAQQAQKAPRTGGVPAGTEGMWTCECGNENYPNRLFCNRKTCGMAKPGLTLKELQRNEVDQQKQAMKAIMPAQQQSGPAPDGSWACASCGNVNFPLRTTCNRKVCGMPREMSDGGPPPSGFVNAPAGKGMRAGGQASQGGGSQQQMMQMMQMMLGGKGAPMAQGGNNKPPGKQAKPPDGSWVCLDCGNINWPTKDQCNRNVCARPRHEVDGGPPDPATIAQGVSAANATAAAQKAQAATMEGPPEGAWECLRCGNVNWPKRTTCNRKTCMAPRDDIPGIS